MGAGAGRSRSRARSAVRIPTGGVLPAGADAVVPIEDARVESDVVGRRRASRRPARTSSSAAPTCGAARRCSRRGRRIRAPEVGVLATLGVTAVPVYRRPVVAVFSSGDELVEPDAAPRPGEIRDSNRYAIAASLARDGRAAATLSDAARRSGGVRSRRSRRASPSATRSSSAADRRSANAIVCRTPSPRSREPGVVVHGLRVKPGKPTLLRRRRWQADSRIARQSDVGAVGARSRRGADRRRARRRAGRRADGSGAAGGARAQPRGLDVVRSGAPAG